MVRSDPQWYNFISFFLKTHFLKYIWQKYIDQILIVGIDHSCYVHVII